MSNINANEPQPGNFFVSQVIRNLAATAKAEILALQEGLAGIIEIMAGFVDMASAQTLTNKRLKLRTLTISSSPDPAVNTDLYDHILITAQAANITGFTVTGTPDDGDFLLFSITATAPQTIAWGGSFEASTVALPTALSTNRIDVLFIFSAAAEKWRCLGVA